MFIYYLVYNTILLPFPKTNPKTYRKPMRRVTIKCFLRHYVLSITTSLCFVVFLLVFLSCFLGGDMMIYHQEDKRPNIRLDVYIQADMRMLRFKSQDYIASFSIIMKFKGKLAPLYGKQF